MARAPRPRAFAGGLVAALVAGLATLAPGLPGAGRAGAQAGQTDPTGQAGLVVDLGDGTVIERCLAVADGTTGEALLRQAGLDVVVEAGPLGSLVCRIQGQGCDFPDEPCLCHCPGGPGCTYWTYSTLEGGRWRYSHLGAQARLLRPGDVDGWAWGPGEEGRGAEPPLRTFDALCGAAEPTDPPPTDRPAVTPATPPTPAAGSPTPRGGAGRPHRATATARPTRTPRPSPAPRRLAAPRPTTGAMRPSQAPPAAAMTAAPPTPQAGGPVPGYPGHGDPGPAPATGAGATALAKLATELAPPNATVRPSRADAAATASPTSAPATLVAVRLVDDDSAGMAASVGRAGEGAGGLPGGGYIPFGLVCAVLVGAWWWLRRGRGGD
jgi:hypothetical protein